MVDESSNDILVLTGLTHGQRARHVRLSLGLRQVDVAAAAKVNCMDITRLEHDRYVLPTRRRRIFEVLGLVSEGAVESKR